MALQLDFVTPCSSLYTCLPLVVVGCETNQCFCFVCIGCRAGKSVRMCWRVHRVCVCMCMCLSTCKLRKPCWCCVADGIRCCVLETCFFFFSRSNETLPLRRWFDSVVHITQMLVFTCSLASVSKCWNTSLCYVYQRAGRILAEEPLTSLSHHIGHPSSSAVRPFQKWKPKPSFSAKGLRHHISSFESKCV